MVLSMARSRGVLALMAITSLVTVWLCRLPQLNIDITRGPLLQRHLDLSLPDAPFVGWPLERVCSETSWTPGLVFVCDNNSGGIGNIRNYMLTCLRYAIDAGATGLVMPRIRVRSEKDLSDMTAENSQPFTYFFDESHFRQSLQASCPQITIYDTASDVPNAPAPFKTEEITPKNLGRRGGCDRRDHNKHTGLFASAFANHLRSTAAEFNLAHPPSPEHPRIFRLTWGSIVAHMRQHARQFDADSHSGRFVAYHLRTENDALDFWPDYANQSKAYLARSQQMGYDMKAGYLATGNETEAHKFFRDATVLHGMRVTTKDLLLGDYKEDLAALEKLTWDQQAVVDFIVLLQSDFFLGVSPSSFSMNVALKRHLQAEGLYTRPWRIGGEGDGRSWLMGKYEQFWEDWLFMYEAMWP
ncbi:uncharacterized protein B0T23DRAFT_439375 [Neurospora hispaniola]|uniref:Alternative oxidase n=1 Tax=Neurospora hispaniola TaxID=588809 RepID=A0AAJ0I901_9PEZI|nr:hypothetical protein B0T23DRAFT_439375 [Neurospora hispaniola]